MPFYPSSKIRAIPRSQPFARTARLAAGFQHVESWPAKFLRWGLLFVFVAKIFGEDMFRIPGFEKDSGIIGLALSAIRGVIIYGGNFGVWPILILYLLVTAAKASKFRWANLWPVLSLMLFMGGMALLSDARSVVEHRGFYFLTSTLPAMASMLHCMDRKGIELVRRWIVGAAGVNIAILMVSGQFLSLLRGDIIEIAQARAEIGIDPNSTPVFRQADSITTAIMFYLAALAGFSLLLDLKQWRSRILVLAITFISIGLAIFTGSRGPMISFAAAAVALFVLSRLSLKRRLLFGVIGCLGLAGGLVMVRVVSPVSAGHIFGLMGKALPALDLYGTSSEMLAGEERTLLYQRAWSAPPSLFGRGVGAFSADIGDITEYVHNLPLEALYETGVVGLIVVSTVFFYCLERLFKFGFKGNSLALFCFSGLIFFLMESQFSGTLLQAQGLLAFLVLGCMAIGVGKGSLRERGAGAIQKNHQRTSTVTVSFRTRG